MTARDVDRLIGVHHDLVAKVGQILLAMQALGYQMGVTDGLRSEAQQQALYAQGRTAPGDIVTNADGVTHKSNHQAHADGFGHAVDCAFLMNGAFSWDDTLPWTLYGAMAKALGLVWGGDWHAIVDRPHVELP